MTWYDKGGGGGDKIPEKTSDVINERPLTFLCKNLQHSGNVDLHNFSLV